MNTDRSKDIFVTYNVYNIYCHFVFQAPRAVVQLPSFLVGSVHMSVVLSFVIFDLFWIGSSIGLGGGIPCRSRSSDGFFLPLSDDVLEPTDG